MTLRRADLDQAVRYLECALVLIERDPPPKARTIREVTGLAIRRLSPGDFHAGEAAAEVTVLRGIAGKLTGEARVDVLKAVAILTDRCG